MSLVALILTKGSMSTLVLAHSQQIAGWIEFWDLVILLVRYGIFGGFEFAEGHSIFINIVRHY